MTTTMTGLGRKLSVTLLIIGILLSVILFSIPTEAMLQFPDGAAGFQHTGSPDSTLFNAFDSWVELGTTTALTSPQLYQRVQNATNTPFLPGGDWNHFKKSPEEDLEYEPDPMSESYGDYDNLDPNTIPPPNPSGIHQLSEFSDLHYPESESQFQQRVEEIRLRNELAAAPSESWIHCSTPSNPNDGSYSPYRHIYSASPSPSESRTESQDIPPEPMVSPLEPPIEFPDPTTPMVTSTHLEGLFNIGDRFDPHFGCQKLEEITKLTFETESIPAQPSLYPTNIPTDALVKDAPQVFAALPHSLELNYPPIPPILYGERAQPPGKHTYMYECPLHKKICTNKENTISHFLYFHEGRVVTHDRPHPCVWDGCDKAFQYPKDLAKHYTTHTKEKKFICVCSKSYSRMDNLLRHQKGNENSRPCPVFQASLQQGS